MSLISERLEVTDWARARETVTHLTVGSYFAYFVEPPETGAGGEGRATRLHLDSVPRGPRVEVYPLVDQPARLPGLLIMPDHGEPEPLGCIVPDRDLYRAGQDTVHLFIAFPVPPEDLRLVVRYAGESFTERHLTLDDGACVEPLAALLAGDYSAQLAIGSRPIGTPVSFTVAEYSLAPLSARLESPRYDGVAGRLEFELAVESYQVPFQGELEASLVDAEREVAETTLKDLGNGRYAGALPIRGDGPFRLRVMDPADPEKVAEVGLPGTRAAEREATTISELGQEFTYAMLPEPRAIPVRGGYLSRGEANTTPILVEEVVTDRPVIHARAELHGLKLVLIDLSTGRRDTLSVGHVEAGTDLPVKTGGRLVTVVAGCVVDGRPFEGYTTFMAPVGVSLDVSASATVRPGEDLNIRFRCEAPVERVSVLVSIRDQRLSASHRPDVALGAATKRAVDAATRNLREKGFEVLTEWDELLHPVVALPVDAGAMDFDRSEIHGLLSPTSVTTNGMVGRYSLDKTEHARMPAAPEAMYAGADMVEELAMEPLAQPIREDFPEVLFYGLIPVEREAELSVPVADSLASFTIEAFALTGGDWTRSATTVTVTQPVRADLELPPAIHPGDTVTGVLRVDTGSGRSSVRLTLDGQPVPLRVAADDKPLDGGEDIATPAVLSFEAGPGLYRAWVQDADSGETDAVERRVDEPGRFQGYRRELVLLQEGQGLDLDATGALSLRVLPSVDEPMGQLVSATAGYAHLCCEQTAAKIVAAVFMYLAAKTEPARLRALEIILVGISREKTMLRPGRGFAMYPDDDYISDHYSPLAVRYLWSLERLAGLADLPDTLRDAAYEGLELADVAGKAHGMSRVPASIDTMAEAYAAVTGGHAGGQVEAFIGEDLDFLGDEVRLRRGRGRVEERAEMAYAGACLIALGDYPRGLRLANQVTTQFNAAGRLYSTVDSVAAMVLMVELMASEVTVGRGRVRVNGREVSAMEAVKLADQVETIQVLEGVAPVEATYIQEENWADFQSAFPVRVGFRDDKGGWKDRFNPGDRTDLSVTLPDGYRPGDLVHVSLPAALTWVHGGGRIKQFTVDFEGRSELKLPLVVTSPIRGAQHFAVCVRNMFEEERATNPGLLAISGN